MSIYVILLSTYFFFICLSVPYWKYNVSFSFNYFTLSVQRGLYILLNTVHHLEQITEAFLRYFVRILVNCSGILISIFQTCQCSHRNSFPVGFCHHYYLNKGGVGRRTFKQKWQKKKGKYHSGRRMGLKSVSPYAAVSEANWHLPGLSQDKPFSYLIIFLAALEIKTTSPAELKHQAKNV